MMLAVIVYGSLYPFNFHQSNNFHDAFRALLATWRVLSGRGDIIANILLYIPLGAFGVRSIPRMRLSLRIIVVLCVGTSLSIAMELVQYYDAGRYTAMSDVYCAAVGTLLGSLAGFGIKRESRLPWMQKLSARPFIVILLTSWLGSRLYPFVPVIDLHKYWDALKPLVIDPRVTGLSFCQHMVTWLVLALLLEASLGRAHGRWGLLLFPAILLARILIDGISVSPSEVCGGAFALLAWTVSVSRFRGRAVLVAVLFAGIVVLEGLEPFQFSSVARPFGWVPFRSLLESPVDTAIISFFDKVFNYGCLVWLLGRAGCSSRVGAALGGALVLGVRLIQMYLPGRSAEITDLIMLLLVAGVMQVLSEDPKKTDIALESKL